MSLSVSLLRLSYKLSYLAKRSYFMSLALMQGSSSLLSNRRGRRALLYHGVDQVGSTRFNSRFTGAAELRKHIEYFCENFHVVSLEDYISKPAHESKLTVTLTFDDGYHGCYKYVLPLLEEYGICASFFITGAADAKLPALWADVVDVFSALNSSDLNVGDEVFYKNKRGVYVSRICGNSLKQRGLMTGQRFKQCLFDAVGDFTIDPRWQELSDYWLQMSLKEIQSLSSSRYVTIGSHGYYHNNLDIMSPSEIGRELSRSKQFLEAAIRKPIEALAFPYGRYSGGEVLQVSREQGFRTLLAANELGPADHFESGLVGRMAVNPYISFEYQMYCILRGGYC